MRFRCDFRCSAGISHAMECKDKSGHSLCRIAYDVAQLDASQGMKKLKYSRHEINARQQLQWGGGRRAYSVTPNLSYGYRARPDATKRQFGVETHT